MEELLALAARCEAASGADRELDAAIVIALDLRPNWTKSYGPLHLDLHSGTANPVIRAQTGAKRSRGDPPIGDYLAYTSDLNAAMSLLPEGRKIVLDTHHMIATVYEYWPITSPEDSGFTSYQAEAATPALALAAAALKARAGEGSV